jgi:hypothetical protein
MNTPQPVGADLRSVHDLLAPGGLFVVVEMAGAGNAATGQYALGALQRVRGAVAAELDTEDLAALDRLLDVDSPHSLPRRDDLAVRTKRSIWAARRP